MSALIGTFEDQSLNALVAGFSFASAIAWMDVARWIISNLIHVNKSSGMYPLLAAVLTTLLAIAVYVVLSMVSRRVRKPSQPLYAVTR
jgi:hypothetical protein